MTKKSIIQLLILVLFLVSKKSTAQEISGVVSDKSGPLPGVSVSLKNSSQGVQTDSKGSFALRGVSSNSILIFSFVGYQTQEVSVGTKTKINILLKEAQNELKEVVVVGYGTQKRGEVTSAVASIKAEDFNKGAVANPLQLIEGRVAGLTISRTSSDPNVAPSIQLRGVSSLRGNNEPLIIIDGIQSSMSGLNAIAPENIGAIDVLKDGSAAAIYGVRGNNGVVIVTTKTPLKGSTQVEYSSFISTQTAAKKPDVLTAEEFVNYGKKTNNAKIVDKGGRDNAYSELLNTSNFSQSHNLTASGGNSQSNYRASINYINLDGIVINTGRESKNISFAANQKALDNKLTLSFNMTNSSIKANPIIDNNAFYQAITRNPTIPIYNADGSYYQDYSSYDDYNPVAIMNERNYSDDIKINLSSAKANYEIIPGLNTSVFYSLEKISNKRDEYIQIGEYTSIKDGYKGSAFIKNENRSNSNFEWVTNYTKKIKEHTFNALIGYSYQKNEYNLNQMRNKGFYSDFFETNNIGSGSFLQAGRAEMRSLREESELDSYFGRLNYNYSEKYLLSASIRREGSTKFGSANTHALFPAISAGWTITKESFMEDVKWVSFLKLRAGYGVTGSLPRDSYQSILRYKVGAGYWDPYTNAWVSTWGPGNNANPDLKWEKNTSYNLGLDFGLLDRKINGSIDVYKRKTTDLIDDGLVEQPSNIFSRKIYNVGSIQNTGVEISLGGSLVKTASFEYKANLAMSYEKNKVLALSTPYEDRYNFPAPGNIGTAQRLQVGKSIGSFYGYKYNGNINGDWNFENLDGKPELTDNDKTFLGSGMPKYKASLMNTFTYKGFDLGIFLRGMFDYKVLNEGRIYYGTKSAIDKTGRNVYKSTLESPITADPRFSDYYLENGDFVRIENISLGYTWNIKESKYNIRSLRLYTNVNNVATITNYSGLNPDVTLTSTQPGNPDVVLTGIEPGIERRGQYPLTTTFTFGLNIGF
jgi:TonB-linked SusC/RagA family outer membrane protein